ncbi:S41 family peptidase [Psychroserpens sp.]|uniref:S41 family peptidase n=1 Tax=Psychroserpens sp. TaxID=2020870 RepID=UPI00385B3A0E
MRLIKLCLLLVVAITFTNCFEDNDDNAIAASEINDFIWKGMNATYLYKINVDDLANDRFSDSNEFRDYLNQFPTPENIFDDLVYEPLDRFSFFIPNYLNFNQSQQGVSSSTGLEFNFHPDPQDSSLKIGVIRLVLPGGIGDQLGLQRGQIFNAIDGIQLTESNYLNLIRQSSYTLNFATYNDNGTPQENDDFIESTTNSANVTRDTYEENPVFRTQIINVDGENVGYLVYNGFNASFVSNLNAAFGEFQANNVQHLVLDLRYNPGGRIDVAAALGSMITGQFNGSVFSKLIYNEDLQQSNRDFNFTNNYNGINLNSLSLNKIYVLTTEASASASELVINSLSEYITVIQIGDTTVGKTQASITLYDSPDFGPNDINPNHTVAIQPLVANSVNVNDGAVPASGIPPFIEVIETPNNYGVLGDINEPLLSAAILNIQGLGRNVQPSTEFKADKKDVNLRPFEDHMYITIDDLFIERRQFE